MWLAFANNGPMSSALREVHQLAMLARTWWWLALVSILVGLIGPFGTFVGLGPFERLAYWVPIVVGTFYAATFSLNLSGHLLEQRITSGFAVMAIGALIAAVPISVLVLAVGSLFSMGVERADIVWLYANSAAVIFAIDLFFDRLAHQPAVTLPDAEPSILRRLPPAKRGPLIRLCVHDHYVEVITERGRELILMRLKDAIAETGPNAGLRVHRSHWVSFDGVVRARRGNGRLFLVMQDGVSVPVSRSYLGTVRESGLAR